MRARSKVPRSFGRLAFDESAGLAQSRAAVLIASTIAGLIGLADPMAISDNEQAGQTEVA